MGISESTLDTLTGSSKVHGQVEYRVKGRILHTTLRGPFKELVSAIPANISELMPRLVQQGKWGQIILFQDSALASPIELAQLGEHLKLRYKNPDNNPVAALVMPPNIEGSELMAPLFLKCYQDANVESRLFDEYAAALDWVELGICQFSESIKWKDSYMLGDQAIDEQHQELFRRAAYVIAATSHEGQVISAIRLFQYMRTHLSHEEDLMRRIQYPDTYAHTAAHQDLVSKLNKISIKIANDSLVKTDLEEFIAHWFMKHMETADSKLAEYFKSQ